MLTRACILPDISVARNQLCFIYTCVSSYQMGSLLPERTHLNLNLNLYLSFWNNTFWNYFLDCAETFRLTSLPFFFFLAKFYFLSKPRRFICICSQMQQTVMISAHFTTNQRNNLWTRISRIVRQKIWTDSQTALFYFLGFFRFFLYKSGFITICVYVLSVRTFLDAKVKSILF